jgi:hypothetical protein
VRSFMSSVFAAVGRRSRRASSPVAVLLVSFLTLMPLVATSASIDISQATIQAQVEKAFPVGGVYPRDASPTRVLVAGKLSEPMVTLEGTTELVVLCGRWAATTKVPRDREDVGRFCAESRLKWSKETGTVSLSQVRIRSLTLGDDRAVPPALLTVLNALVPPMLEGVVVYTAPKMIGWAIKDLKVLDGRLRIDF